MIAVTTLFVFAMSEAESQSGSHSSIEAELILMDLSEQVTNQNWPEALELIKKFKQVSNGKVPPAVLRLEGKIALGTGDYLQANDAFLAYLEKLDADDADYREGLLLLREARDRRALEVKPYSLDGLFPGITLAELEDLSGWEETPSDCGFYISWQKFSCFSKEYEFGVIRALFFGKEKTRKVGEISVRYESPSLSGWIDLASKRDARRLAKCFPDCFDTPPAKLKEVIDECHARGERMVAGLSQWIDNSEPIHEKMTNYFKSSANKRSDASTSRETWQQARVLDHHLTVEINDWLIVRSKYSAHLEYSCSYEVTIDRPGRTEYAGFSCLDGWDLLVEGLDAAAINNALSPSVLTGSGSSGRRGNTWFGAALLFNTLSPESREYDWLNGKLLLANGKLVAWEADDCNKSL